MKLLDFFSDPLLNALRMEMGAPLVESFSRRQITLLDADALRRLGTEGIDVEDFDDIGVEADGTLSYKGKRVTVYIRDIGQIQGQANMPRFHFAFCRTLERMRRINRWNKYVVANRDDGIFAVNVVGGQIRSESLPLNVCQNCLDHITWKGFCWDWRGEARVRAVQEFRLADFFSEYPKDLISSVPQYTADVAPINDYTSDWAVVSEGLKLERNFQCDSCRIQLVGVRRKFLHVHHADGQKFNNNAENLIVLCIACHAEMPMHGHMKTLQAYRDFEAQFGASRRNL